MHRFMANITGSVEDAIEEEGTIKFNNLWKKIWSSVYTWHDSDVIPFITVSATMLGVTLKLRPYGAIQICLLLLLLFCYSTETS